MLELGLLTLAISASVGPTKLLAIQAGLKKGASSTFFITFGAVLVDLFYANISGLGLAKIGENSYFQKILLIISAIVFIYLAIKGLKIAIKKDFKKVIESKYKIHPLFIGMTITLVNPLTIIFWPGAVTSLNIGYKPLIFLIIIPTVGGLWSLFESLIVHFGRSYIKGKTLSIIEIITSVMFLGFATKFIIQIIS